MYDVVIAGLGGMGSAVASHCAKRGVKVAGIEQFSRGHALGASSGKSRIIRKAYFEDAAYVPLLLRAYELWRELERESGRRILDLTGLLLAGYAESDVIVGSLRAARQFDLPVEQLDAGDMRKRYPTLGVLPGEVGVYEPDGGAVFPETAIEAHLVLAERRGAQLRFETAMERWEARDDRVTVLLADGSRIEARALVLTLGPWFAATMQQLGIAMRVQRNVQVWFDPASSAYSADRFPAFLLARRSLPQPLYGFPDFGDGVKAAFHGYGELTSPERLRRDIDEATDVEPLRSALEGWMPGASGPVNAAKACMYSLTPDEHFVIDRHPEHRNVVVCGGFSGHGFKFASVVGELGADLALDAGTRHDIAFLGIDRFTRA